METLYSIVQIVHSNQRKIQEAARASAVPCGIKPLFTRLLEVAFSDRLLFAFSILLSTV